MFLSAHIQNMDEFPHLKYPLYKPYPSHQLQKTFEKIYFFSISYLNTILAKWTKTSKERNCFGTNKFFVSHRKIICLTTIKTI